MRGRFIRWLSLNMRPWIAALLIAVLTACAAPRGKPSVYSDDIDLKIRGIKAAVKSHDRAVVPQLVKDLSSDDPAVRFYASDALEKLTGQNFDYRYFDDEDQRKAATERWKEWLDREYPAKTK